MKLYWTMAIRNLRRHLRRTLLTISGMALGFTVLFWLQCILKGTNYQIVESVTSTSVGHLQIWQKNYLEEPLIQYTFQPKIEELKSILPEEAKFSERVHLPSLISSGEQSAPISLVGIHPEAESQVTKMKSNLVEGDFLSSSPDPDCKNREIYIGVSLASLLKVNLGDKIVLMAQAADGTLGNELLRVKGLFKTGSQMFDRSLAYAPIDCVRKIGMINGDHEVTIRLPASADLSRTQAQIENKLSQIGTELRITTWKEAVPPLAGMVTFNNATLLLISLVLFTVTTFGIVNTLMMSVFERTREFGVMLALGVSPTGVCILVLLEAILIGLFAAILGTLIGILCVLYNQKYGFDLQPYLGKEISVTQFKLDSLIFPIFSFQRYFILSTATVFFATFAGLLPALRASKMNVIEAIKDR